MLHFRFGYLNSNPHSYSPSVATRDFSTDTSGLHDTNDKSKFSFDFTILKDAGISALSLSTDPAHQAEAKRLKHKCALDNFNKRFGLCETFDFKDLQTFLSSTKEGSAYQREYRLAFGFFMSTFEAFGGLDLSPTDIERIQEALPGANESKRLIAKAQDVLARRHEMERRAVWAPYLKLVREKTPLLAITLINSSHLTVAEGIELRRIIDENERDARQASMIIEHKNVLIRKIKAGLLDEKLLEDIFG